MALYAFDGTWNQPDYIFDDSRDTNTNVFRFAQYYAACHGEDASPLKFQYLEGVGTKFGRTGKVVGGLTGAGGRERILEMLRLCASQMASGDRVVDIVGFSRGAALALHFANRLCDGVRVGGELLRVEEIRFLGLWDTVPAFGIPGAFIDWAQDINIGWELDLPSRVRRCSHALARHERRQAFNVHRLDPRHRHENVFEVWFRGVHSDVGGGNSNHPLNAIALQWMMQEASKAGVPFLEEQLEDAGKGSDVNAPIGVNSDRIERIDRAFYEGDLLHPSAARSLAVGESKTVPVDSRLIYDFSGLILEAGASYTFTPDPAGRWNDDDIVCDSTGWPENLSRNTHWWGKLKENVLESRMVGLLRRVRSANWFELCACLGFRDDSAFPVGKGQFRNHPWVCPHSAPLNFLANDSVHPVSKYGNNHGTLNVTVKRLS